jgi:cytochrome bd-type quinol oxidase subunit 2
VAEETEGQEAGAKRAAQSGLPPSGDRVSVLWRRLIEHRIVQWSVGYAAVAYGIQHAVTLTIEALDWPHGLERASMILLALGLPVAMTIAWYHGDRASRRISGPELSIISILLVIGAFLFYVFARPTEQIAARPAAAAQTVTAAAPVKPAGISVAVLPFLNLSGDPKE